MLIFVPVAADSLATWASRGAFRPQQAVAVTPTLTAAFGFRPNELEDAEHTALQIAGLSALLAYSRRLVAVVESSGRPMPASDFGAIVTDELAWRAVISLFAESDPSAARELHSRLGGLDLDAAWSAAGVGEFLADNPLLWHGPTEWSDLVGRLDGTAG